MPYQVTGQRVGGEQGTFTSRRTMDGDRTGHDGDGEWTYDELYEEARKRGLKGRSKMSKTELERALAV